MRSRERELARKKLDKELKYYRWAGRDKHPTDGLLRAVRHALGVPAAEMLRVMEISPSVLFRLEKSELRGTISLGVLERVADAMGCQVVYAVIPKDGKTLEELAEKRTWEKRLGTREQGIGNREQGSEIRDQRSGVGHPGEHRSFAGGPGRDQEAGAGRESRFVPRDSEEG